MTTCMIFVFAALLEYAVVQWISRQEQEGAFYQKKMNQMRAKKDPHYTYESQFDKVRNCFQNSWFSFIPCVNDVLS